MPEIVAPQANTPIVDENGVMTDEFQRFIDAIARLDLLVGTGSPEGVIEATIGREYLDTTGAAGAVKYIKQLADIGGDRTQGWIAI